MLLEEDHEESKADVNHYMDVLEQRVISLDSVLLLDLLDSFTNGCIANVGRLRTASCGMDSSTIFSADSKENDNDNLRNEEPCFEQRVVVMGFT